MSDLAILMNGITLQHVGELLLEVPETKEIRSVSSATYRRCLEDFTFAYLIGGSIGNIGPLPTVGSQQPGNQLVESFEGIFSTVQTEAIGSVEELLSSDESFRREIEETIATLPGLLRRQPHYFYEWITREAAGSFGCDDSLTRDLNPENYCYDRQPPYLTYPRLQRKIPKCVIERLSQFLQSHGLNAVTGAAAISEFVSRNILTHIANTLWYEHLLAQPQAKPTLYLPHVTRGLLQGGSFRRARQALAPFALADVLRVGSIYNREDYVTRLKDLRATKEYEDIRNCWMELAAIKTSESREQWDKMLFDDIERMSKRVTSNHDRIALNMGHHIQRLFGAKYRYRSAFRKLIVSSKLPYDPVLFEIFRELRPESDQSTVVNVSMSGVVAKGPAIQSVTIEPRQSALTTGQRRRAMPSQRMSGIISGGTVRQQANIPLDQLLERIDAVGDVQQLIELTTGNLDSVAKQLADLRSKIQAYDPNATAELSKLTAAEEAAKKGDSSGVIASLKGLGKWVSDFASKVGAAIVARLIEKQMGL